MHSTIYIHSLKLRHPFGISRGTVSEIPTVLFAMRSSKAPDAPILGIGEGSPVRYKGQKAEDAVALLEKMVALVTPDNVEQVEALSDKARAEIAQGHSAALCAFDLALWDARGRRGRRPLFDLFGTDRPTDIQTSYTIGLSEHDTMEQRAREAAHLPLIKVKLGRGIEFDLEAMRRIRAAAPNSLLRVDANAGWTLDDARTMCPKLADMGVDLVEQPLAIGNIEGMKALRGQWPVLIVADEDAQDVASLEALRGAVDGINIKLMKCGGLTEALRMIRFARNEGWKILVGCMIETRLGLGAAAHLGGLVDYLDLDAYMLTTNDPFPPGSSAVLTADAPLPDHRPGIGYDWPLELS